MPPLLSLEMNLQLIPLPSNIANEFNEYFSSIAGKLQKSIYTQDKDFNDYLLDKTDQSFFIKATHKFEIIDTITSSIKNKASGPNSFPNIVLQQVSTLIT